MGDADQLHGRAIIAIGDMRDEIERLRACLKYEEHRFATQSTHSEGCHSFGPRHYECALQEVERLRAEVAEWKRVASAQAELHDTAERELVELRERIANGVVADVAEDTRHEGSSALVAAAEKVGYYEGHRVRLLVEDAP